MTETGIARTASDEHKSEAQLSFEWHWDMTRAVVRERLRLDDQFAGEVFLRARLVAEKFLDEPHRA